MKIVFFITLLTFSFSSLAKRSLSLIEVLQDGDIIFQQSQSGQAAALRELTNSIWTHTGIILKVNGEWYVAEARKGVELTLLNDFINRTGVPKYIVKRLRPQIMKWTANSSQEIKEALMPFGQRAYDFWFEWGDDKIYCSELVWKAYKNAFNLHLTDPERFKDFPLSGPYAQRLINSRYTQTGRPLNLEEPVVSPVAILQSDLLIEVMRKE